jgi:hypothetical protein
MQVLRKQWNQRVGREDVNHSDTGIVSVRVNPPWLLLTGGLADNLGAVSHRRHGTNDCFGTGDSAHLHVWVRQTSSSVMVMMTKRLETSLGPGKA